MILNGKLHSFLVRILIQKDNRHFIQKKLERKGRKYEVLQILA